MIAYLLALLIGVAAGLRDLTTPAAVSWAAHLPLDDTWLALLGYAWATRVLTFLSVAELVTDQLLQTPSRTVPVQFGTRRAGCPVGSSTRGGGWIAPVRSGGAVLGTLGGRTAAIGKDSPAALIEEGAIPAALLTVTAMR
jgi:uncharacterized membrane protein